MNKVVNNESERDNYIGFLIRKNYKLIMIFLTIVSVIIAFNVYVSKKRFKEHCETLSFNVMSDIEAQSEAGKIVISMHDDIKARCNKVGIIIKDLQY
ncbi:MAG: hypothetical protein QM504_17245 [Pseudomonadota bacterium]